MYVPNGLAVVAVPVVSLGSDGTISTGMGHPTPMPS